MKGLCIEKTGLNFSRPPVVDESFFKSASDLFSPLEVWDLRRPANYHNWVGFLICINQQRRSPLTPIGVGGGVGGVLSNVAEPPEEGVVFSHGQGRFCGPCHLEHGSLRLAGFSG